MAILGMLREGVTLFDCRLLLTSALIVSLTQLPFFCFTALNFSDRLEEFAYGLGYMMIALGTLVLKGTYNVRQIVVTAMVSVWALRLSLFLLYRSFFMRDFRMEPHRQGIVAKASFWFFQTVEVWLTSLPVILLNSFRHNPRIGVLDLVGFSAWVVGFGMETLADHQKFLFKEKNKQRWCDVGLFQYSRHPNYFGDILAWFGIFLTVAPTLHGWTWISVLAPVFHAFVILFVSGIPPCERKCNERWGANPEYQRYKQQVPILIPAVPNTRVHRIVKKAE